MFQEILFALNFARMAWKHANFTHGSQILLLADVNNAFIAHTHTHTPLSKEEGKEGQRWKTDEQVWDKRGTQKRFILWTRDSREEAGAAKINSQPKHTKIKREEVWWNRGVLGPKCVFFSPSTMEGEKKRGTEQCVCVEGRHAFLRQRRKHKRRESPHTHLQRLLWLKKKQKKHRRGYPPARSERSFSGGPRSLLLLLQQQHCNLGVPLGPEISIGWLICT